MRAKDSPQGTQGFLSQLSGQIPAGKSHTETGAHGVVLSPALVAIVDDDPRIQELLGAELTDLNQIHCSYSSADALLSDINNSQPALIFLDVLMPGMGGMECLKQLRQHGFGGAVVMFSALNDAELQEQAKPQEPTAGCSKQHYLTTWKRC